MKIWIVALVALASSGAFASRLIVTCDEGKKSGSQFSAQVNFDPVVVQDTMWKSAGGASIIETYKQGNADEGGTTTARVSVGFPSRNRLLISEFYSVNVFGLQEETPVRMFHGHDKDKKFDVILSVSDSALSENPKNFEAVLAYAPVSKNRIYRHVILACFALVRD